MKKPTLKPNSKYHQGHFQPLNPEKYVGKLEELVYRSGLEKRYMKRFDENPAVVQWASEEINIPYVSPVDGQVHRYFPDFLVTMKKSDGTLINLMVEIKPMKDCIKPVKGNRSLQKYASERITYEINKAKWQYAMEFCKKRNMLFEVLTEENIKIK